MHGRGGAEKEFFRRLLPPDDLLRKQQRSSPPLRAQTMSLCGHMTAEDKEEWSRKNRQAMVDSAEEWKKEQEAKVGYTAWI